MEVVLETEPVWSLTVRVTVKFAFPIFSGTEMSLMEIPARTVTVPVFEFVAPLASVTVKVTVKVFAVM